MGFSPMCKSKIHVEKHCAGVTEAVVEQRKVRKIKFREITARNRKTTCTWRIHWHLQKPMARKNDAEINRR